MQKKIINKISLNIIICLGFLIISCTNFKAYFNTFYNAQQYFEKAEKIRLENRGDVLSKVAMDNYKKVIKKSKIVLDGYPQFNLRKAAFLLTIQSQFYLEEYRNAQSTISLMKSEYEEIVNIDASFWFSMIKWKEGKVQPAINELFSLINTSLSNDMKAKIYLAIAEIYFEQEMQTLSMDNLILAAEFIRDPNEKGQIYYRIADLSFVAKKYDLALSAYKQTIKNSETKKQIQESNLRTVQIYRLQGNLDLATKSIKNMLLDENYSSIFSDLELELAKLYIQLEMIIEARNRLESIVQDYKKTKASAEAYYRLGQYSISKDWDLDAALKYFTIVPKEYNESLFKSASLVRIKEIDAYKQVQLDYKRWILKLNNSDSLSIVQLTKEEKVELSNILYSMAELESFHFDRSASGILYLDKIIELSLYTDIYPKALYAKAYLLENNGNDSLAFQLKKEIVNKYSNTDYALAIMNIDSTFNSIDNNSDKNLVLAEKNWKKDPIFALDSYREILDIDSLSESSAKAAYFLAYQYDYRFVKIDSALKYYNWILKHHNSSKQAIKSLQRMSFLNTVLVDSL